MCTSKVQYFKNIQLDIFSIIFFQLKKVSHGFFKDFDKVFPEINNVTLGLKAASAAGSKLSDNVCNVTKTILKISSPEFANASTALSNLNFNFMDIANFYANMLNCLSDQATPLASTSIRNLNHLIYQLQTYVIPGAKSINDHASAIGNVFGSDNTDIIQLHAKESIKHFEAMIEVLRTLVADFKVVVDNGIEITNSSARSFVNATVLVRCATILTEITVTTTHLSTVVSGFTNVTASIESVSSDLQTSAAATSQAFAAAARAFSLTINNSKGRFLTRTDVNIMSVVVALSDFETVLSNIFVDDDKMRNQRDLAREYYANITNALFNDNLFFQTLMLEFDRSFTENLDIARKESEKAISELTVTVSALAAKSRKSSATCFGKNSVGVAEILKVMEFYRNASSFCIQNQINVTIQAQTLKTFINEDVVLNFLGASDELCGCLKKDDKVVNEKSRQCVKDVRNQLLTFFIFVHIFIFFFTTDNQEG
jgi:hypothetical protein